MSGLLCPTCACRPESASAACSCQCHKPAALEAIGQELNALYERRRPLTRVIREQGSFGASPAQAEELANLNAAIDALQVGAELLARRAQAVRTAKQCVESLLKFEQRYRIRWLEDSPLRQRSADGSKIAVRDARIRRGARLLVFWAIRRST